MHEQPGSGGSKRNSNKTSISECPESFAKWYCLNGATCFSVTVSESTLYNCWCPIGFHGLRCDYKYVGRKQLGQSERPSDAHQIQSALVTLASSHKANLTQKDATIERGNDSPESMHQYHHEPDGRSQSKQEAVGSSKPSKQQQQQGQQLGRDIHLIVYNISVLLLLVIFIVLLLRLARREGGRRAVNDDEIPDNQGCQGEPSSNEWFPENNGQINHQDSGSIGLSLTKLEQPQHCWLQHQPRRSQHETNNDKTAAHYQKQHRQKQQLWQHTNYIKLLHPREQLREEQHNQQEPQQRHHNQQQVQCISLTRNSRQHLREPVCLSRVETEFS